jgi:hypothetical protein
MKTIKSILEEYEVKRSENISNEKEIFRLFQEANSQIRELENPKDEISDALKLLIEDPCNDLAVNWLIAAQFHPSSKYLDALCELLSIDNSCIWHEAIVEIMYDVPDEKCIPSLQKALNYTYEYDPTYELGRKILETLYNIETPEALEIIREYTHSINERLRDQAKLLLDEDTME